MPRSKPEARPPAVELVTSSQVSRAGAADTIIEDLRGLIATGAISKGSRLPTERDLATVYKVSPSTVRESMRALAVMGLVEVRHGSGSYVVEDTTNLVTSSLATALQMEGVSVAEIISMLSLINERAVVLAIDRATVDDVQALTDANARVVGGENPREILDGVVAFLTSLAASAHEPLLMVFARFLVQLLDRIEVDLFPPETAFWQNLTGQVGDERAEIIAAISAKDAAAAVSAVQRYHQQAVLRMETNADSFGARLSDERFAAVITALIASR
ncbi:FadR/GntR family transcriptional regulator [Subtercola sp. YIM 133946]|uniref:FadR/GntR family transcriptional regulator n=1 Tax=Subtercola sp. YIM 133946 TaxID=3118909 RepID=UPI002F92677A